MKQVLKYTGYILVLFILGYLLWRFSYIIVWVLIAAMISFIGQPLVTLFDKARIRRLKMPRIVSAILALIVLVLTGVGFVSVIVPLIINQAETISSIDVNALVRNLEGPLNRLDEILHDLGAIPEGETINQFAVARIREIINLGSIGTALGKVINTAGSIIVGVFSILFISFFFLKDENLFEDGLLLFIPEKHHIATRNVVKDSKNLLIRYYLGVLLEVIGVMSLVAIVLRIFGFHNALLIGFFVGLMNIIPYIGPIIGGVIGLILGTISIMAAGAYDDLLPASLKLLGTFAAVNFIDNNILIPVIYSKSVKSHPLEIFLVIIIGGGLAGFVGMLFAVPVYTLLRVIAKEFFQQFRVVKKLTETINDN
ncbi:MAG: AI-2E family transporter [Bacteroidales bacterium]|jgi:predicted PurR-regulated permease PerM|nr:AI-2E family transporter [Bacteroidales bacterium]